MKQFIKKLQIQKIIKTVKIDSKKQDVFDKINNK